MTTIPDFRSLLQELIALPSLSSSDPVLDTSNSGVIDALAGWLGTLGFECRVQAVPDCRDKYNLIARLGSGEDGLLLAGHADTVPYDKDGWESDPFTLTERNGGLYGLGSADMKGFLALVVDVLRGVEKTELKRPLLVLATANEESGMEGARALKREDLQGASHAVIGEPTGLKPVRLHKGIFMESIRVRGKAGHSSDPAAGLNAIEGMQSLLQTLDEWRRELASGTRDEQFEPPHTTLNLGVIRGGDSPNRIPALCELQIDCRFPAGQQVDELRNELRQRLTAALNDGAWRLEFDALFPGTNPFATPKDAAIVQACEQITGQSAGAVSFATEGAFLNALGLETVILGPGHIEHAHQPNEFLPTEHIEPTRKILRNLIGRFCMQ